MDWHAIARRPDVLTLAATLLGWLGWSLAGWFAAVAGFDDLMPLAHALGVFAALTAGQYTHTRLAAH